METIGRFKIPVKDDYIDIDLSRDTPLKLTYVEGTQFAVVELMYTNKRPSWTEISEEEFLTYFPKSKAEEPPPEPPPPEPSNSEIAKLMTDIYAQLYIAGVI